MAAEPTAAEPVPEPPGAPPIDRRSQLSYDDFAAEYMRPRRPVIITDGLTEWPALRKWTPEFFKVNFGTKKVAPQGVEMTLGAFIDLVLASTLEHPAPYLSSLFVRQQFPEIAPDIEPDLKYTWPDRVRSRLMVGPMRHGAGMPELLIAGRGSRFRLHYDALHALGFVTQIHGDKEFMIFPPGDGQFLYPTPERPNLSAIDDIFEPDLDRFPLYSRAAPIRFVLRKGETIFNPAGWWHGTRMLTPSIALVISTINATNWSVFVADIGRSRDGVPWVVTAALRGYLHCVGACLTLKERIFSRST